MNKKKLRKVVSQTNHIETKSLICKNIADRIMSQITNDSNDKCENGAVYINIENRNRKIDTLRKERDKFIFHLFAIGVFASLLMTSEIIWMSKLTTILHGGLFSLVFMMLNQFVACYLIAGKLQKYGPDIFSKIIIHKQNIAAQTSLIIDSIKQQIIFDERSSV